MKTLEGMIKYDELLHKNWDKATEEQRLRIDKLKLDIAKRKKTIWRKMQLEMTALWKLLRERSMKYGKNKESLV